MHGTIGAQSTMDPKFLNLPLLFCWSIWLTRNIIIFEEGIANGTIMAAKILTVFHEIPEHKPFAPRRPTAPAPIDKTTPWAYFDGATQEQGCGGGFILHINEQHYYSVKLGLGGGTNNYAELITLRHLLHFSLGHKCINLQIFGDSKIIIN